MSTDKSHLLDGQFPKTWDEYVGQEHAKEMLQTLAQSARLRDARLPHILISGPPGLGKTALAIQTCREAGRKVYPVAGAMDVNAALDMFETVSDGDIVFYDEFHQIAEGGKTKQGWLLNYLENGVLMTPYGVEEVPKVTFLAATTDKGMLLPTILDRFEIINLDPYSDSQAAHIAIEMSRKVLGEEYPALHPETAALVAAAGNNAPRRMRGLVMKLRDLAVVGAIAPTGDGKYPLEKALRLSGLTPDGLTKDAVAYMCLLKEGGRKPVSERVLKARLGLERGDGLKTIEMLLMEKGFLAQTSKGRMLTMAGSARAKDLLDVAVAA